jgi:hypothetical protein
MRGKTNCEVAGLQQLNISNNKEHVPILFESGEMHSKNIIATGKYRSDLLSPCADTSKY